VWVVIQVDAYVRRIDADSGRAMADLMTTEETADYLRVKVKTLHNWRSRHVGPPATKVVGGLRYRRSTVDRWLEQGAGTPRPSDDQPPQRAGH
jgi:helix-turn-helix protein